MAAPYYEQNKDRSRPDRLSLPFYASSVRTVAEGYRIEPHWHDHVEILYWSKGRAIVTVGSQEYDVNEGSLVIIPAREVHSVIVGRQMESFHYVIGFDTELLAPMPKLSLEFAFLQPYRASLGLEPHLVAVEPDARTEIEALAVDMCREFAAHMPGFELAVTSCIYRLVLRLIRDGHLSDIEQTAGSWTDTASMALLIRLLSRLADNCHEPLAAREAAKQCSLSYSRFASVFKSLMRTSYTQYLAFLRVRRAEQLLLDPRRSITDIALECGFEHPSYFIKQFKRAKGISPLQYRKVRLRQDS